MEAKIISEGPIKLSEVAQRLGMKSVEPVGRWVTRGKRGVKLEAARLDGKSWRTSWAALARFSAALRGETPPEPPSRSRASRATAELRQLLAAGRN